MTTKFLAILYRPPYYIIIDRFIRLILQKRAVNNFAQVDREMGKILENKIRELLA